MVPKVVTERQNLTPDIFSYIRRIEVKLSTHNHLNINQNS